ncbi:hypothetical protein [Evansella tamaricis]|nr:hypothetical protein [Evansella tamaricis]
MGGTNLPFNPFERYADDAVIYCNTEDEASKITQIIKLENERM